jgi:hypothetical protein
LVVVARDSGRAWVVTAMEKDLLGRDGYALKDTNGEQDVETAP